jgi:hypothetical protein
LVSLGLSQAVALKKIEQTRNLAVQGSEGYPLDFNKYREYRIQLEQGSGNFEERFHITLKIIEDPLLK